MTKPFEVPPYDPKLPTPEQWAAMVEKGRAAWADVPDADKWLEDLRGGPAT
jgi:hypothetical protein